MTAERNVQQDLIEKATKDPVFKKALMEDPRTLIQKHVGVTIPPGVDIHVVEETPNRLYLVLPSVGEPTRVSEKAGCKHTDCSWGFTCSAGSLIGDCCR